MPTLTAGTSGSGPELPEAERNKAGLAPRGGRSHVVGETISPLRHATIPEILRETVSRHGERDAVVLVPEGRTLSYREFADEVESLACGLLALGLEKGDRVGIWSPNRLEWLLTQFATAELGLILVNVNPAYRQSEVEYALNKVQCKALITAESFKKSDYLATIRALAPELANSEPGELSAAKLPTLRWVVAMSDNPGPGILPFRDLAARGGTEERARLREITDGLRPDDAINIQFTSGTTGSPKAATLTHANVLNNGKFSTDRIRFSEIDRLCLPVPLYHCFGMVVGALGCITQGAAIVLPGEAFEPAQTLRAVSEAQATALYGVPTMFIAMLEEADREAYDLSSLRTGVMAGSNCPIEVMQRVIDEMGMDEVTICYGMTETSPVSFQSFVDDPIEKRVTTIGRIHPHLEVKIVGEDGEILPVGQSGELCTRGYSVMLGYWDDEEKTRECIVDGWVHTGDLASLDEDGFCQIVGRLKDMIIRGGENISPREIEEHLFRHPEVKDAQVFGIPDYKLGEKVCAWIVPRKGAAPDPGNLRAFCADEIAHFKVPEHFRIVDELPMTVTGKPQKFAMREWMIENGYADSGPSG